MPCLCQGLNFSTISAVSGVGLRVASSRRTPTEIAEATHFPSENTTCSKVTDALDGLVVRTPEKQA